MNNNMYFNPTFQWLYRRYVRSLRTLLFDEIDLLEWIKMEIKDCSIIFYKIVLKYDLWFGNKIFLLNIPIGDEWNIRDKTTDGGPCIERARTSLFFLSQGHGRGKRPELWGRLTIWLNVGRFLNQHIDERKLLYTVQYVRFNRLTLIDMIHLAW